MNFVTIGIVILCIFIHTINCRIFDRSKITPNLEIKRKDDIIGIRRVVRQTEAEIPIGLQTPKSDSEVGTFNTGRDSLNLNPFYKNAHRNYTDSLRINIPASYTGLENFNAGYYTNIKNPFESHPTTVSNQAGTYLQLFTGLFDSDSSQCVINMLENYELNQPLYISGTGSWILPDELSKMNFTSQDQLVVDCGRGNSLVGSTQSHASLKCQGGQMFVENGTPRDFASFKCRRKVESVEWPEASSCGNGGKTIAVGFETTSFGRLKLYEACVMPSIKRTLYVKHNLKRGGITQKLCIKGKKQKPWYHFKESSQLGGSVGSSYKVLKSFDRGHLSPRGDYVLFTHQEATYNYINVAPQKKSFNQGSWGRFEMKLRKSIPLHTSYTIYTGTYGMLPGYDENFQVPLWFYKVICDNTGTKCVAYLGLNKDSDPSEPSVCTNKCGNAKTGLICCDMKATLQMRNTRKKINIHDCCKHVEYILTQ